MAVFQIFKFKSIEQQIQYMKTRSRSSLRHQNGHSSRHPHSLTPEKELISLEKPKKMVKIHACTSQISSYDSIPHIPQYHLSVAEMQGSPLPLLARLQKEYSSFGAIKLVPPAEWSPQMEFKRPTLCLTTRLQPLHLLAHGKSFEEKKYAHSLTAFHDMAVELERKVMTKLTKDQVERRKELQQEYWSHLRGDNREQKITVQYAADLPANRYGSGFPLTSSKRTRDAHFDYALNGFNLNNTYRQSGSLLAMSDLRGQAIGGISAPWVYVGMLYSSFCWHVEDSGINSINYNHAGSGKVWYVVPQQCKESFDGFVEDNYGDRQVVNKITFMIDPLELTKKGIKVYKAVQQTKQFICTFFNAYHCGFSLGFNIGQAVNFLIPQSLPYISRSLKSSMKPSVFCYEWLVYENYVRGMEQKCVPEVVTEQYHRLLAEQEKGLKRIWGALKGKSIKHIQDKVKYTRYLCSVCKKYLYLSFIQCKKCEKDYCLSHSEVCCEKEGLILCLRRPNKDRNDYLGKLLQGV